jgi:hypothetical protein
MSRLQVLSLLASLVFVLVGGGDARSSICGGVARREPLGPVAFRAVLDTVAAGWNSNRPELAASCYHGIVVVHLDGGLIRSWREYQYGSPLAWEGFVGPSR